MALSIPWATVNFHGRRVLLRGGFCHYVIVVFLLVVFFEPPKISSATLCGHVWLMAPIYVGALDEMLVAEKPSIQQ